jgi:hypothetical protein
VPPISPISQVWHTPVRHDHRTGTSHASTSSRWLCLAESQRTSRVLRANDTSGPEVDAVVGNQDVGFVEVSQEAEIKIDTFPFTATG